jgi:GNAT superfamily N-acetyltransferase
VRFVSGAELGSLEQLTGVWPEFLLHDAVSNRYWNRLYDDFVDFQFALVDEGRVVAEGNCVPVKGMPLQWRDAILNAFEAEGEPDRVCALAIVIAPEHQGTGLSGLASAFGALVAPVRPTRKSDQPHLPIEDYAALRREDGTHVDPWIRTHERAGGRILGTAEEAMLIEGSLEDWRGWTGLDLPTDGDAIVPGALVPVRFENGHGVYREPCVWLEHRVD